MKLFLRACALVLLAAPLSAQMIQVIPAPSTAAPAGLHQGLSTGVPAGLPPVLSTAIPAGLELSTSAAKSGKTGASQPAAYAVSRAPLSGIVLMPTAYRGNGKNSVGLGLDINAAYYIGRLYGKNSYTWTTDKKNYLDRLGVWLLTADGKMQVQTEGDWRPAMAAGVQGMLEFRDSPQPTLNQPTASVKINSKTTDTLANAYVVLTKRLHPKFLINAGYSDGDMPKVLYSLSEFLSKEALSLNGYTNVNIPSGMVFGGFMWLPRPDSPIGMEILIPQGAPQSPKLINLHLGTLLKLNFELSYLTFKGGWDMLGMFQFRYNYFPK